MPIAVIFDRSSSAQYNAFFLEKKPFNATKIKKTFYVEYNTFNKNLLKVR